MLDVSVIIPVWNDAEGVRQTLVSLQEQALPASRFEVIVVDNGSSQPPDLSTEAPNVRLLIEPRPGSYCARNLGIQHARGAILAFTDANCIAAPSWLESALAALAQAPERAFVAGSVRVRGRHGDRLGPIEAYETVACFNQEAAIRNLGCAATANLFVPRSLMTEIGPFDEAFSGGDYQWCRRAMRLGATPVYAADAEVTHPTRGSRRAVLDREGRLVGGHRDLSPGAWACMRYVLRNLLPPRRNLLDILALPANRISQTDRLHAALFALQARWYMAWTRLKLEVTAGASAR